MIGGVDAVEVARTHGTPVILYDVGRIRQRARMFREAFARHGVRYQVAYASKALSILGIYDVVLEEGLAVDVVSGGELATALAADVPAASIHVHGNNKSEAELRAALEAQVGCIVVDNLFEVQLLDRLTRAMACPARVLLRVAPGVTAHTHTHLTTGQTTSKFGLDLPHGAAAAVAALRNHPYIHLLGLHCHIGSQIFAVEGYAVAATRLLDFLRDVDWMDAAVLNLGGGFGIRYTDADTPRPYADYIDAMVHTVRDYVAAHPGMTMPELWIEPGRALVGDAGTTLYTAGAEKDLVGGPRYVAVDGGMNDNLRPALYQATYRAAVANRMHDVPDTTYTIVGKLCETGDRLIEAALLPALRPGDLVAVFCTGAYGYAMASNYNRLPRPAVVFAEKGEARVVVQRETYADLLRHDRRYRGPESSEGKPPTGGDPLPSSSPPLA